MTLDYRNRVRTILEEVAAGGRSVEDASRALKDTGFTDLHFSKIDHEREHRCGFAEVIFAAAKTTEQVSGIMAEFARRRQNVLVTRLGEASAKVILDTFENCEYDAAGQILAMYCSAPPRRPGKVGIVTAGTSDIPVAREAAETLRFLGYETTLLHDVGVAGIHRLFSSMHMIEGCQVLIVAAGMEAALPSVLGGLISMPLIAVPTSVGYGTSFGGLTALLGMLNSCASGITVVNIDNGFGAACAASRILSLSWHTCDTASQQASHGQEES